MGLFGPVFEVIPEIFEPKPSQAAANEVAPGDAYPAAPAPTPGFAVADMFAPVFGTVH